MNNTRYTKGKVLLKEHLETINQNAKANMGDVNALISRVKTFFKNCGYNSASKNSALVQEYIIMIFHTQDCRCSHWIETLDGELNGVWNNPGTEYRLWKTHRINYEVDHVVPLNAGGSNDLENLQFLSPNANRFIKSSMTYEDLLRRVDLSDRFKFRIKQVLSKRKELFSSSKWKNFISKLEKEEINCDHFYTAIEDPRPF